MQSASNTDKGMGTDTKTCMLPTSPYFTCPFRKQGLENPVFPFDFSQTENGIIQMP